MWALGCVAFVVLCAMIGDLLRRLAQAELRLARAESHIAALETKMANNDSDEFDDTKYRLHEVGYNTACYVYVPAELSVAEADCFVGRTKFDSRGRPLKS